MFWLLWVSIWGLQTGDISSLLDGPIKRPNYCNLPASVSSCCWSKICFRRNTTARLTCPESLRWVVPVGEDGELLTTDRGTTRARKNIVARGILRLGASLAQGHIQLRTATCSVHANISNIENLANSLQEIIFSTVVSVARGIPTVSHCQASKQDTELLPNHTTASFAVQIDPRTALLHLWSPSDPQK